MDFVEPAVGVSSADANWSRRSEEAQLAAIWNHRQRQTLVIVIVAIAAVVAVVTIQTPASRFTALLPPPWPTLAALALVGIGLVLWSRAQDRRLRLALRRDGMRNLVALAKDREIENL